MSHLISREIHSSFAYLTLLWEILNSHCRYFFYNSILISCTNNHLLNINQKTLTPPISKFEAQIVLWLPLILFTKLDFQFNEITPIQVNRIEINELIAIDSIHFGTIQNFLAIYCGWKHATKFLTFINWYIGGWLYGRIIWKWNNSNEKVFFFVLIELYGNFIRISVTHRSE